jgi:UDP-N-acetylmuramoyl-L-alanyl-D-glutamate--2,6-diaminopimelate ligase
MTGMHNVYNALAVAVCAYELGIEKKSIINGLNSLSGVKGRLEWIANHKGGEVFIDFAHTPDGLEKSLIGLKSHCKGRLICLFGCGGNRDQSKRAKMGKVASAISDFVILTSDNPRYEDPTDIIKDIESGIPKEFTNIVAIPNRERAIAYAMNALKAGDVLLVAGKGGEDYQERMGIKYAYKDEDVIIKITKKE